MSRRQFVQTSLALTAAAALPRAAWAQAKPLRMIVPFAAGGPTDAVARRLAEALSPLLGRTVIVDNKAGGAGSIGTAELVRAAPDGNTISLVIPDNVINVAFTIKNLPYDARTDLTPIATCAAASPVIAVRSELKLQTMKALIDRARAAPNTVSFASWGPGTFPHLMMGSIESATGVKFLNVPYRGTGPAVQDFMAGQVQVGFLPVHLMPGLIEKGWAVTVAVAGPERVPQAPEVPTLTEAGFGNPLTTTRIWMGLVGPPGLPADARNTIAAAVAAVSKDPKFVAALAGVSHTPFNLGPDEFKATIARDYEVVAQMMRQLNITPDSQ